MPIGRGWYPEEPTDEFQEVARVLLKEKISDIFRISQSKHEQRIKEKGNEARFDGDKK